MRTPQVGSLKVTRNQSDKGQAALNARLEESTAEKQRLASKLASTEDDRNVLQKQLQEVHALILFPLPLFDFVACRSKQHNRWVIDDVRSCANILMKVRLDIS